MKNRKNQIDTELKRLLSIERNRKLYLKAKELFIKHKPIGHNWEHVERDIINAVYIGTEEKADMDIVMPAMILHDLGYITHPADARGHGANGANECLPYLDDWSQEDRKKIADCIRKHKGKFPGHAGMEPESLEEQVVCDADQLDKFGWVGFMQMFLVYIEHGLAEGKPRPMRGLPDFIRYSLAVEYYTHTARKAGAELTAPDFAETAAALEEELRFYQMPDLEF